MSAAPPPAAPGSVPSDPAAPVADDSDRGARRGPGDGGQSAGKGLVFITAAKLWFMLGGAALGLLLPRMFPRSESAARYGQWATVLSWLSVLSNVIVTATIRTVARYASQGPEWVRGTQRVAVGIQVVGITVIGLAYFLAAPYIAHFEHDPALTLPLQLSTGVLLAYGYYAVFVGAANGARAFHKQAGLDIGFSTLRTVFVLGAALLFSTVVAAVAGFVFAAAAILVASVFVVGWGPAERSPRTAELVRFAVPVAVYLFVMNALMFVDLWWLKRLVAMHHKAAGLAPALATELASQAAGAYNAVLQIARLPYQAIIAVTFVVFPLVSRATFDADRERTRSYVDRAVRLSLLVVVGLAVCAAARPDSILLTIFPSNGKGGNDYLIGASAMPALMFAYVLYSLFTIAGTIFTSSGRTLGPLLIGVATLGLDAALNYLGVHFALARDESPLVAAAVSTTLTMGLGLLAMLVYLQRSFGASLAPRSALRIAAAAALALVVGHLLPLPGRAGLAACVIAGLVYLAALFGSRELGLGELSSLLKRG